MHEEINQKSVALSIKTAKLTSKTLAKAMLIALRHMKRQNPRSSPTQRNNQQKIYKGKQTLNQLSQNGGGLQNVEITEQNIKFFEPVARKYNIDYALHKDDSENPPKWLVFFKAKDIDMLTLAFKEFGKKALSKEHDKPSKFRQFMKKRETEREKPKNINMRRATKKINLGKNQRKFEKEQAKPKFLDMKQATKKIKIRERSGWER